MIISSVQELQSVDMAPHVDPSMDDTPTPLHGPVLENGTLLHGTVSDPAAILYKEANVSTMALAAATTTMGVVLEPCEAPASPSPALLSLAARQSHDADEGCTLATAM
uniref:Uncharacterized protein n=1 Tax=Arundo donax TaxID=35708 RepID=A0A0A9GW30_ARUDO